MNDEDNDVDVNPEKFSIGCALVAVWFGLLWGGLSYLMYYGG